jgi:HAD superfamily hydrolase (TIGR01490 family)
LENTLNLAIFDFDGTLTTGHLWIGIARHHRTYRVKRLVFWKYFFSHLPFLLGAKIGIYNEDKARARWGEDMPVLIKGYTREQGREVINWVIDHYVLPSLRKDMLRILDEHKKLGHKVMLLSGTMLDFLDVIGQRLGADYVVGTKLEMIDGAYSGKIVRPLCFGEAKGRCLLEFIKEHQLNVDLGRSTAYADSVYDASVLRLVGNPVAVYPEKELYHLAVREKWQIIGNSA